MMGELRRLVRHFGEWVELEPQGLLDRIKGSQKADERDQQIDSLLAELEELKAREALIGLGVETELMRFQEDE